MRGWKWRWWLLSAVLFALIVVGFQLLLWGHVSDDGFITFRYVERLVSGKGLTFNDGERVEGFSHPLWALLLALGVHVFRLSEVDVARGLGVGLTVLTLVGLLALGAALRPGSSLLPGLAVGAAGLWLVFPGTHVYATAGLETPLLGLLLTAGVLLGAVGRGRLAAFAFGLAGITRPEGILYGTLWFAFTFPRGEREEGPGSRELIRAGIVLAPAAVYEVFRLVYFGSWLPNSVLAKPPGTFGGLLGLDYLWQAVVAAGGLVIVGLMALVRVDGESEGEGGARVYRHVAGPILASVLLVLYAWGDWMPFGRFLVPVWPLVTVTIAHWIVDIASASSGRVRFRYLGVPGTMGLLFVLFAVSALGAYGADLVRYASSDGLAATLMRGEDQLAVGRWLAANVAPGSTVVTTRLGAMSYAAPELTFWDERGLTDREQALWIARGRPGGDAASPVFQRRPDVVAAIAVPAAWSYTNNAFLSEFLESGYELSATFPQGNYGEVHVWVRSER